MKKNIIKNIIIRGILGIPIGIAIVAIIGLIFSINNGVGNYIIAPPALISKMGNEVSAATLQIILAGILGMIFSVSSIIWDNENLSYLNKSLIYFTINLISSLIIAYISHWIEITVPQTLGFLLQFIAEFLIIWVIIYAINYKEIKKMNEKLKIRKKNS